MMEKKKKNQAYNGRCRTHEQRSGRALDDAGSGAAAGIKPVFISRADIRQFKKKDEAAGSLHMCERVRHKAGGHRGPLPAAP